nr:FecR domain-containing protein [uncultured Caulobacter sp.]
MRAIAHAARQRRAPAPPPWHRNMLSKARQRWAVGIAITGLVAASVIVWKLTAPTYSTDIGRQTVAELPDGTRVRLNTDTALKVRFDNGLRRVELLRGQAFFDVAHDHAHPFVVVAGDTEVRALGTRFDVRRADGGAKVVLAEGKVAVTERGSRSAAWTLEPGQTLTTGRRNVAPAPVPTDLAVATGWTEGRVSFRATPLEDAVDEINRYSRDKVILSADVPAHTRVNGDFAIGKPMEFVTAMTTLYGLKADRRLGGDIELKAPEG